MIRKPLLIVLALISFVYSCTKIQTTDIGSGLIPPIDGVITKDTILDVVTNTFLNTDTARVYFSDEHVIGNISNDPLFGKTTSSTFLELKPTFYPFYFQKKKEDITSDSAVLVLSYKGVYGDSTVPQTWRVFEVSEKMRYDTAFPANYGNISYGSQLGIKSNFDVRGLDDSVINNFERSASQIRIKLNSTFATRLIKQYDSTNAYADDSAFQSYFKGFAIVADQGVGNALLRVNLLDTNTKLALYYSYKTDATPAKDTSVVSYFRFSQEVPRASGSANFVKRDYTGSQLATYLNTNKNDSLSFVQTMPGTFVQVKVPGLKGLPNSIINRAELIAEQVPDISDRYLTAPRYLLLSVYDSVNKIKMNIPNDFTVDQSGANNVLTFGGYQLDKNVNGNIITSYNFNMTRYVQGIVTRKDTSYTLRLTAPSNDSIRYKAAYPFTGYSTYYFSPSIANIVGVGRVRLGGGSGDKNRPYRMRLRIIYSKL